MYTRWHSVTRIKQYYSASRKSAKHLRTAVLVRQHDVNLARAHTSRTTILQTRMRLLQPLCQSNSKYAWYRLRCSGTWCCAAVRGSWCFKEYLRMSHSPKRIATSLTAWCFTIKTLCSKFPEPLMQQHTITFLKTCTLSNTTVIFSNVTLNTIIQDIHHKMHHACLVFHCNAPNLH
jgi:hypothetical protein